MPKVSRRSLIAATAAALTAFAVPAAAAEAEDPEPLALGGVVGRTPDEWSRFVGEGGLEPPHPFGHRNLNPARLPIPPLARVTGQQ